MVKIKGLYKTYNYKKNDAFEALHNITLEIENIGPDFTDETAVEIKRVIDCYREGRKLADSGFTRGLYYRGIE